MLVYFLIRNQNNTSVLFNLLEKNSSMNKGAGIKRIFCFVQVQLGWKIKKLVTDITKLLVN